MIDEKDKWNQKRMSFLFERVDRLFAPRTPLTSAEITHVENQLDVILSNDFKKLSSHQSYEFVGSFAFYNFGREDGHSVIGETLSLRKNLNFLNIYIVLYEEANGFMVMETQDDASKPSPIIYCSVEDAYQLAEDKPLEYQHTIFPNFTVFFQYLLDEEEKERRGEEKTLS